MDSEINIFKGGVQNVFDSELIEKSSAQDEQNWICKDGRLVLAYGRNLIGAEGAVGKLQGLHFAYKINGEKILYRKTSTKVQYWTGSTWSDVITGLTLGAEYSFANYSSLSGSFVFLSGIDGFYKINTANPGSFLSIFNAAKNDKGRIMIDRGRLIMWNCVNASKTTLKLSWVDRQNATVYTTVTDENLGASGSQTYSGTLAFKTAARNCFNLTIKGTVAAGLETFKDNYDGTLTSDKGGAGTINYTTGAYSVTFSAVTTEGNILATYQWEDSAIKGLADFTWSATRIGGEGNMITQDIGGDAILSVQVGQDGAYYSLKEQSAYKLDIDEKDLAFTNLVYRTDLGIPYFRASVSTAKGVVFMNTANPDKPELIILQRNPLGDNIEPYPLFNHFKFSLFDYSDCCVSTWERYIIIACKTKLSQINNRILLCDMQTGTVDIVAYGARMFAKSGGFLYAGSPVSESVFQLFNGFDDESELIENFWISKAETYQSERLKKFRRLRLKGLISPDQKVDVWIDYDESGFEKVGTILGSEEYVDITNPQIIGSSLIGEIQISGDQDVITAYPFFVELKLKPPKFRKRTIKLIATSLGYVDINMIMDFDIIPYEQKVPRRFREQPSPPAPVIVPEIETLGEEIIVNGTFETADNWVATNLTYDATNKRFISDPALAGQLEQAVVLEEGKKYKVLVSVVGTGGNVIVYLGSAASTPILPSGDKSVYITATGTTGNQKIYILTNNFDGILDNISCKRVL